VHPRLALNSLSSASWSLEQDLELYAELGVEASSWYLDKLEATGIDRAMTLVRESGIRTIHVFAKGITPGDPPQWPTEQARLIRGAEIAAELGAPWLVLTIGSACGLGWDDAADALGRGLEPLRGHGVGIAVEQTLPIRVEVGFVHSLRDSVDLAERLDLGVVVETNYCFAERGLAETFARGVGRFATIQVSDLVPPSTLVPDRAVPGDGVIPFARIVELADACGYTGPFELELIGPRIEAEGYASAIRRSIDAFEAERKLGEITRHFDDMERRISEPPAAYDQDLEPPPEWPRPEGPGDE